MSKENVIRALGVYSGIIGVAYIAYGVVEMMLWLAGVAGLSWLADSLAAMPLSPSRDAIAGFVLLTIGSMLVYRLNALLRMKYEGLSFLLVGVLLSTALCAVYVLMMGADALDASIVGEAWEFDASTYNLPAIVLSLALSPCWLALKYRNTFSE